MLKKTFSLLLYVALGVSTVSAYTALDIDRANALAAAGIIIPHSNNPDAYRFEDRVSRQEVIAMALKLGGISFADTRVCRGYFSDANFSAKHTDAWVCRVVETAADAGLITRENPTTRPRDTVTRVEALAIVLKASGIVIDLPASTEEFGVFLDASGGSANTWQAPLLTQALRANLIEPTMLRENGEKNWFWQHNSSATRRDVFELIMTLKSLKDASHKLPYLIVSWEVGYAPAATRIISVDPQHVLDADNASFKHIFPLLAPKATQSRVSGSTLFIVQMPADQWGKVTYSTIATVQGRVIQQMSSFDPYPSAIRVMLQRFNLKSEQEFYDLPYGDLWESTRDFVESYFLDQFMQAKVSR